MHIESKFLQIGSLQQLVNQLITGSNLDQLKHSNQPIRSPSERTSPNFEADPDDDTPKDESMAVFYLELLGMISHKKSLINNNFWSQA